MEINSNEQSLKNTNEYQNVPKKEEESRQREYNNILTPTTTTTTSTNVTPSSEKIQTIETTAKKQNESIPEKNVYENIPSKDAIAINQYDNIPNQNN